MHISVQKATKRYPEGLVKKNYTQGVSEEFLRIVSAYIYANANGIEASLLCYCDCSARRTFRKMYANNDTASEKEVLREGYKGVSSPRAKRAGVFFENI